MAIDVRVGDRVKLLSLPEWLVHDLPSSEREEMNKFVDQSSTVVDIDAHGYYWLGFGATVESSDSAKYSGHSFAVPRECIEHCASDEETKDAGS